MPELPLRDIHLPDPINWWPLAWGWWVLFAIILLIGVALIRSCVRPTLRKEALKSLHAIEKAFEESENGAQCVADLSALFRRVVLSQKKRASLTGDAWLQLLDSQLKSPEFSCGVGKLLVSGPYQPYVHPEDVEKLLALSRKWMERL